MVKNEIDSLTPGPSFRHNLCFKYPNESCKPILEHLHSNILEYYNIYYCLEFKITNN
jgi:hypothetical protein